MLGILTCMGKSSSESPVMKCLNNGKNLFDNLHVSKSTRSLLPEGTNSTSGKSKQYNYQDQSLSECSADSDDSIIVFNGSPGTGSFSWNHNEDGGSSSDEDEMCIIQGSVGESNKIGSDAEGDKDDDTIEDTCDDFSDRLREVNQCWQIENPPAALERKSDGFGKQVCFAPPETLQTVYPIIAWDFAYRASRVGPWEQIARDRARFWNRIERTGHILAPVLSPTHRKRMLEHRQ